jgi:hypothetical protein
VTNPQVSPNPGEKKKKKLEDTKGEPIMKPLKGATNHVQHQLNKARELKEMGVTITSVLSNLGLNVNNDPAPNDVKEANGMLDVLKTMSMAITEMVHIMKASGPEQGAIHHPPPPPTSTRRALDMEGVSGLGRHNPYGIKTGAGVAVAGVTVASVAGASVVGARVVGAGVVGAGVVGAGVVGAGVVGAGVVGASGAVAGEVGAGVVGAGVTVASVAVAGVTVASVAVTGVVGAGVVGASVTVASVVGVGVVGVGVVGAGVVGAGVVGGSVASGSVDHDDNATVFYDVSDSDDAVPYQGYNRAWGGVPQQGGIIWGQICHWCRDDVLNGVCNGCGKISYARDPRCGGFWEGAENNPKVKEKERDVERDVRRKARFEGWKADKERRLAEAMKNLCDEDDMKFKALCDYDSDAETPPVAEPKAPLPPPPPPPAAEPPPPPAAKSKVVNPLKGVRVQGGRGPNKDGWGSTQE